MFEVRGAVGGGHFGLAHRWQHHWKQLCGVTVRHLLADASGKCSWLQVADRLRRDRSSSTLRIKRFDLGRPPATCRFEVVLVLRRRRYFVVSPSLGAENDISVRIDHEALLYH